MSARTHLLVEVGAIVADGSGALEAELYVGFLSCRAASTILRCGAKGVLYLGIGRPVVNIAERVRDHPARRS